MHSDYSQIGPYLIAMLAVFVLYRRFRRNFGRQVLRPKRMVIRTVLFAVIGGSLLPLALRSTDFLAAIIAGGAVGAILGIWGAKRTRFETFGGALHYVPHTYTGIAVSLLFLGRLVYRIVQLYANGHVPADVVSAGPSPGFASSSMVRSPLTLGLFFILIGYYACYYGLVLWKSKHLTAKDTELPSTAASE
jgi:hypothetical protein